MITLYLSPAFQMPHKCISLVGFKVYLELSWKDSSQASSPCHTGESIEGGVKGVMCQQTRAQRTKEMEGEKEIQADGAGELGEEGRFRQTEGQTNEAWQGAIQTK